jgi:glutathione S-transferase
MSKGELVRTLYGYWLSGPTYKVVAALALLDLPYQYRHIDLRAGANRTPEFRALNPFSQVPVLVEAGVTWVQSGAILTHLAETNRRLDGVSVQEQADIRAWLYWDTDQFVPAIFRPRARALGFIDISDQQLDPFRALALRCFKLLERRLADRPWLATDHLSIADIAVAGSLLFANEGGYDVSGFPNLRAYRDRFAATPGIASIASMIPKGDMMMNETDNRGNANV